MKIGDYYLDNIHIFRRRMLAHRRTKHDPKHRVRKFACDKCDAKFSKRPRLNKHIKYVHHGVKSHKCEECDKSYKTRGQLLVHMHYKHTKHGFVKQCPGIVFIICQ